MVSPSWDLFFTYSVNIYDDCNFSQNWQHSENIPRPRRGLQYFCTIGKYRESWLGLVLKFSVFSLNDFCSLSQNWQFFGKSAKIVSPSYDLSSYFQYFRHLRKIAIVAAACKPEHNCKSGEIKR